MDGQGVAKSFSADPSTLEKELREIHREARTAAAQKNDRSGADEDDMVIRGATTPITWLRTSSGRGSQRS